MPNLSPGYIYIGRRLLLAFLSLLVVSIIIFWVTQILPGDAAQAILGRSATPERLEALRSQLHLDQPALLQYWSWIEGFVRGDLGRSLVSAQNVSEMVLPRVVNSATLMACVSVIAIPLSIMAGILAAERRGQLFDNVVSSITLALAAVPEFVVAIATVMLFATVVFQWFPPVSLVSPGGSIWDRPVILVLPTLTLVIVVFPYLYRMVRGAVIDVLDSEYIEMARLKGVARNRLLYLHTLPNALAPVLQAIALTLGYLVGGVVLIEVVFGFPGLGEGLVGAVSTRDIPLIQSIVLILGGFYVIVNLMSDILSVLVTPKLRTKLWPR